tara:strand:- start:518 stop:766 length:249 start_codon:yes stop_codon:yes gene_type:complete
MRQTMQPLPHWTWDDLETALGQFDRTRQLETLRTHLLDCLRSEATSASPPDLLAEVLSTAWVLAQVGASATDPHPEGGRSAC